MAAAVLRNLRIKRVALVDRGANYDEKTGDGAHIVLHKAAPRTETKETPVKKNILQKLFGLATEPDAAVRAATVAEITKEFPDGDGPPADVHKADDPMCKCADCMSKRTSKSLIDPVEKRVVDVEKANEALRTENAAILKRLDAEITKRETDEVTAILKSFKATPIDLTTDVEMFLKMKRETPAIFDRQMAIMKATDLQLSQSGLYKDFGSRSGAGEGSAWAQIEAKADQLLEKSSDSKLTRADAINRVMDQNPKLVKQYRAEQQ